MEVEGASVEIKLLRKEEAYVKNDKADTFNSEESMQGMRQPNHKTGS